MFLKTEFSLDAYISLRASGKFLIKIAIHIRGPHTPRKRIVFLTYILYGTTQNFDHSLSSSHYHLHSMIQ